MLMNFSFGIAMATRLPIRHIDTHTSSMIWNIMSISIVTVSGPALAMPLSLEMIEAMKNGLMHQKVLNMPAPRVRLTTITSFAVCVSSKTPALPNAVYTLLMNSAHSRKYMYRLITYFVTLGSFDLYAKYPSITAKTATPSFPVTPFSTHEAGAVCHSET